MSGRLYPHGSSELVHELLSAAREEAVPVGSRERVARQLGISLRGVPGGAPALELAPEPRDVATRGGSGRFALELSWLGVVSALLVGAPGSMPARAEPTRAEAVMRAALSQAAEAPPLAPAPSLVLPPAGANGNVSASASRSSAPPAARAKARHPGTAGSGAGARVADAPAPNTLLEEVHHLDRVRDLLGRGDGPAALVALERYERTFAAGELGLEARVLRVAGEFAVGRGDTARTRARDLLATPGTERYRSELRRLLVEER